MVSLTSDDSSAEEDMRPLSNVNKQHRKKRATAKNVAYNMTTLAKKVNKRDKRQTTKPNVNTSNTYAILTDNEDENITDKNEPKKAKAVKVPPLICIDAKYNDIMQLITGENIKNFNLKCISLGIKVFCSSLVDFEIVRGKLSTQKIQYFTHDVAVNKTQKFVLSGLPNFPIDDIKTALQELDVPTIDIKKMKTKSSNENYALYLVYFNNNSTNLQSLRKVKYVLNVVVDWKPYYQARNGPTQCSNCQLYGHGNKNCNLQSRCAKCGLKHHTANCTKDQQQSPDLAFTPKCCLCAGTHSSKDKNCPKRLSYIQMNSTSNNMQPLRHSSPLKTNNSPGTSPSRSPTVNKTQKYSDWFKDVGCDNGYSQSTDDLLPNELLSEMMIELFQGLRASKTRLDQIQTVTSVVLKYSTININV